jgi:hypothetical protein
MNQDKFTMTFENAFSDEWCDRCILEFEKARENGRTKTRIQAGEPSPILMQDRQFFLEDYPDIEEYQLIIKEFRYNFFTKFYPRYQEKFGVLKDDPCHVLDGYKIQKTEPGEGYHVWHYENSGSFDAKASKRFLVYTVSLNDVDEGGETEFLYQHFRLKQRKGSLTIFPAGFTHTHRGNPPLSNVKYIMTGWLMYMHVPD